LNKGEKKDENCIFFVIDPMSALEGPFHQAEAASGFEIISFSVTILKEPAYNSTPYRWPTPSHPNGRPEIPMTMKYDMISKFRIRNFVVVVFHEIANSKIHGNEFLSTLTLG
jgi:hypothetical protein